MESTAYEGGVGGKIRRRPTRRPAATPYDRPPSAVRVLRGIATSNGKGGGWLSKLVDPASRFISGNAYKLFSSVFRKRLTAPPVAQEQNSQVRLDVPEAVDSAPIELHGQEMVDGQNPIKNVDTHGISEIEQLLKQKTYTRAQVDYLTELIRIRTIEPSRPESESKNEKVHISHKGNGIRSSSLNEHLSTSATDLSIPRDIAASPAEIAKAYMSSQPPKPGYLAISSRNPIFTKDQSLPSSVPFSSKSPGLSAASQSVLRSSEAREFSGTCYDTPRPRGRSAIYRMSRSPYFRADPSVNRKENDYTTGSFAGPTSSQWTPGSTSKSDVKQVLKRGRPVLDSDYGSFGPIRRIRQKSGLISAAKESSISPSSSLHGFKRPATQKPSSLNEIKFESTALQIAENGDNLFSSKFPLVSEQSSEFGRKILEQLDKFVPSPGGKSHAKPVARDESPSKLTTDMLNGRALRSMENVDASQLISMDANGNLDFSNKKVSQNLRAFDSEKLLKAEENGFSKPGAPGVKFAAAANGVSKPVLSNKNARPIISSTDTTIFAPVSFLSQRKPAFQMTAPEDLLEVDDEHDAVDTFVQSASSMAKDESKIANLKASVSSISAPEKPLLTSAKNMGASSSISFPEASKKAYDASYISEKDSMYKFPVAIESGEHSLPAITPTMPTTSQDKLAAQSEHKVGPAFIFGSRTTDTPVPSIVSCESGPELICPDRKIQLDGSNIGRSVRSDAVGLHKSPGIVGSSSLSAPSNTDTAAFGSLISSPQINGGSVPSSSISSFVSESTTEAVPRSSVSSFFSNSTLTTTSSSSSTSPPFSSTNIFNFGAGASIAAPVSVSPLQDQSNLLDSEEKIANNSPFGSSSSTAHGALAFLNTGSSSTFLMGSSPFSGSGNTYSAVTMPTSSPSIATSSVPATPYSFSGVSSSGSDFTASPSLPSKSNGIFGFSASVQATSPIFSAASSSSQNSNIGSTIVAQPAQSGSGTSLFSQSSTTQLGSLSSSATPGLSSSSSSSIFGSSSPSTFGINSSSSPKFGYVPSSTTIQSANPFSSSSGFNFSSGNSSSSNSGFSFSSGTCVSGPSSGFSHSISSVSNSSSGLSSTGLSTSSSGFPFSASTAGSQTPASSISSPAVTSGLFGSSSLGSTSSNSGSVFGSSPSTGFSFGLTGPASGVTDSFGFGSSPAFSFASAGPTMLAGTATPVFGMQSPAGGLSSISQNNDQMSVEDTMADDMSQAPAPMVSTFGQPNSAGAISPNFVFGSASSGGASVFQFGSNQNSPALQNPNPFQSVGNLEFVPGGSFSLGSGGGEKSARKIVKVRRDKIRRK